MTNKNVYLKILILYDITERYEVNYISEFFKMCGSMVVEEELTDYIIQEKKYIEKCKLYDKVLVLRKSKNVDKKIGVVENQAVLENMVYVSCHPDFSYFFQNDDKLQLSHIMQPIVNKVFDSNSQTLEYLVNFYIKYSYCKENLKQSYFLSFLDEKAKMELFNKFKLMVSNLKNDEILFTNDAFYPVVLYVKQLCSKKVNDVCKECNWTYYFKIDKLYEECINILAHADRFPCAYVLAANICNYDLAYSWRVPSLYNKALSGNECHPAFASIYCQKGYFYEKSHKESWKANQFYKEAYDLLPEYYRAQFKLGIDLINERKFTSAIENYLNIVKKFRSKRELEMIFPIEYEFLCKSYILIGIVYGGYWCDNDQARVYYRKAIRVVEEEIERSNFSRDFFGDTTGTYKRYLKQKIALDKYVNIELYK